MAAQENSLDIGQQQELGKSEFLHPPSLIHFALRKAKTVFNFGLSGCNTLTFFLANHWLNWVIILLILWLNLDFMIELGNNFAYANLSIMERLA